MESTRPQLDPLMKKTLLLVVSLLFIFSFSGRSKDEYVSSGKEAAAAEFPDLPLPFGVGAWYFGQEQEYVVTGLRATAFGNPVPGFGPEAITRIENRVDQCNFKGDYWVLPWLNFHGLVGTASGEAVASINPALQGAPFFLTDFIVGYDALVYGGGLTLAAGYQKLFATVTADYTWGDVDMQDGPGLTLNDPNGIETLVVTPKIGLHGRKGAIWVGAYYQFTQHTQTGTFILPGPLPVDFAADVQDKTPWTPVIGGEYYFSEHWALTIEGGFGGDRRQGLVGLTYRF